MKAFDWERRTRSIMRKGVLALAAAALCATALPGSAARAQDGEGSGPLPVPPLLAPFTGFGSAQLMSRKTEKTEKPEKPKTVETAEIAETTVLAESAPALKSLEPMVGPLIKHYYADVIDRRTTAYIPEDLDELTPIEMPDTTGNWVRVDLSEQRLVAYSGQTPIREFIISSGLPATPTVTGTFHVRAKVRSQLMEGGSRASDNYYNLPNVEWVQYFYEDYGLHGTYWHNDFGRPKSHGCVNMTNADAHWLWDFLGPVWDGSQWQTSTDDNPGSLVIVTE